MSSKHIFRYKNINDLTVIFIKIQFSQQSKMVPIIATYH